MIETNTDKKESKKAAASLVLFSANRLPPAKQHSQTPRTPRSHALRGNAYQDASRPRSGNPWPTLKATPAAAIVCLAFLFSCALVCGAFAYGGGRDLVPVSVRQDDGTVVRTNLYQSSRALLIGVSDYTAGWPDLDSVPSELRQVKDVLESQGFYVEMKLNPDADQMEEAFDNFIDNFGFDSQSRLLFFFAGHGHTRRNGTRGYLVPADAPDPRKDEKGFLKKALPMSQILAWSRRMEAKHVLFLFDSCFSGTVFTQRDLPEIPPAISELSVKPVRQYITAGGWKESVPARSVFAPAFVNALKYRLGDLNRDGYVSGTELGLYLQSEVPKSAHQLPQYGKIPDPDLRMGDFVFLVGGGEPPVPKATVAVKSKVRGAMVFLDDRLVGNTDLPDHEVSPGTHTIRVEKPGYRTREQAFETEAGRSVTLVVDLSPEPTAVTPRPPSKGRLFVNPAPDDARVRILNIAPPYRDGIELDPGPYHLEVSASGYETRKFWIDLDGGEDKRLDIALGPVDVSPGTSAGKKISNDLGMEFVYIPPGSFTMGSPSGEPERDDDEKQHRVTLTKGFYMQTTEVTVGQWRAFARETGYRTEAEIGDGALGYTDSGWQKDKKLNWKNPGFSQSEKDPVTCVSWNDAQEYIQWLSKKDGAKYSLPTEAQWEYAARAGTTAPFSFGNCLSTDQANYDGNHPMPGCPKGQYREKTVPMASFSPNAWGLLRHARKRF